MTAAVIDLLLAAISLFVTGAALLGTGAQVSAWAYQPDVRRSKYPDSPVPRLFEDFSLFFTSIHDEDRDDVARARYLRYSILGWKWLRCAALLAHISAWIQVLLKLSQLASAMSI